MSKKTKTDPIFAAIDAAKKAWKNFEEICDIDDCTAFDLASPSEKKRLLAMRSRVEGVELRALRTVCNTKPTSILGAAALIDYMQKDWTDGGANHACGATDNLFDTLTTALRHIAGAQVADKSA